MPPTNTGNLNRTHPFERRTTGFTLLELIVVISMLSVVLAFTLPKLQLSILSDPFRVATHWLVTNVATLKQRAVQTRRQLYLHIDIDTGRLWDSDEAMSDESRLQANQNAFRLSGGVRIIDVAFSGDNIHTSGTVTIGFSPKGFSDTVMIHMEDQHHRRRSLLVEPFLLRVKIFDSYINAET